MTLITTTYNSKTHKLVPIEPTDEWKYKVMRHYQPNLSITSKAWKDLTEEMLYWHKAITAAPTAPSGWQPIESAPRDGRSVFLYADGKVIIGAYSDDGDGYPWRFVDDYGCVDAYSDDCDGDGCPTQWMPIGLPTPPAP